MRKHLLPAFGATPLSAITHLRVQQLVNTMAARLAPKTVKTNYGVLRAILNAAVNDDRIARSPCRAIVLPRETRTTRRTLTPTELHNLTDAMPPAYRLMVPLAGIIGLRWSEVVALRVSSLELLSRPAFLDVVEAMPTVDGIPMLGPTKSPSSTRKLPLPDVVAVEASAHLAQLGVTGATRDALLFPASRGGPLVASNFCARIWRPALHAADLTGITFHDLRRTAMTLWGESGLSPRAIQLLAGHSDPRLSQSVYQQVTESLHLHMAARLDSIWTLAPPPDEKHRAG